MRREAVRRRDARAELPGVNGVSHPPAELAVLRFAGAVVAGARSGVVVGQFDVGNRVTTELAPGFQDAA